MVLGLSFKIKNGSLPWFSKERTLKNDFQSPPENVQHLFVSNAIFIIKTSFSTAMINEDSILYGD